MENSTFKSNQTKKICKGVYKLRGFYISAYYGEIETVWNIYTDSHLINEYAVGFNTKKECIEFLSRNKK